MMAEGSQEVEFKNPQPQKVLVQVHSGAARCRLRLILHPAIHSDGPLKRPTHQRSLTNGGGPSC